MRRKRSVTNAIDTGCVFGGKLTALQYPEKEFVSVPAKQTYCESARPFLDDDQQAPSLSAQQLHDDILDAEDVIGKRIVSTRLQRNVTIREENATAALEVMSRFAANPTWLIYLPPTMSPSETTGEAGLLEHLAEAFSSDDMQTVLKLFSFRRQSVSFGVLFSQFLKQAFATILEWIDWYR